MKKKIYEFLSSETFYTIAVSFALVLGIIIGKVVISHIPLTTNHNLFVKQWLSYLPIFIGGASFVANMLLISILQTHWEEKLTKLINLDNDSKENSFVLNQDLIKEKLELSLQKDNDNKNSKNISENSVKINYYIHLFTLYSIKNNLIREDVFSEWQDYLKNTITDDTSIYFVGNLIKKLTILNGATLLESLEELQQEEMGDMIDLLIYFGRNGILLAQLLKREIPELKKERVLNQ